MVDRDIEEETRIKEKYGISESRIGWLQIIETIKRLESDFNNVSGSFTSVNQTLSKHAGSIADMDARLDILEVPV